MDLTPLTPAPAVTVGDLDLVAVEAGWDDDDIVLTVHAVNGSVKAVATYRGNDVGGRESFALQVSQVGREATQEAAASSLVHLRVLAESCLRTQQKRAAAAGGESDEEEPEPEPELIPLDQVAPPAFPVDALPGWLADWVRAIALDTQTPTDLAAGFGLVALSVGGGGKVRVLIKPGWREPTNIYVAVALGSGERKTPVYNAATAPGDAWERDQNAQQADEITKAASRRRILEKRLAHLENEASRAKVGDQVTAEKEVEAARAELAGARDPVLVEAFADDITSEKVPQMLHEQGGRLAILSDEGGILDIMAGRYSEGGRANYDVYLKGHSGSKLRVKRIGRAPDYVDNPALTVGLAIQPAVLRKLRAIQDAKETGLLARFLFCVPRGRVGYREVDPPPMDEEVSLRFHTACRVLLDLPVPKNDAGTVVPHLLSLSPDGRRRLLAFARAVEPELRPEGALGTLAEWGGKLTGHVARLAGLLHLGDWAGDAALEAEGPRNVEETPGYLQEISLDTVERAIALGRYFVQHAKIAFAVMRADPALEPAKQILRLYAKRLEATLSRRDLLRLSTQAQFPRARDLDAPLALLVERGWLVQASIPRDGTRGRLPAPVFRLSQQARVLLAEGADATKHGNSVDSVSILSIGESTESTSGEINFVDSVDGFGEPPSRAYARTRAAVSTESTEMENGAFGGSSPEENEPAILSEQVSTEYRQKSTELDFVGRWADWLEGCASRAGLDAQWREIQRAPRFQDAPANDQIRVQQVYAACVRRFGIHE